MTEGFSEVRTWVRTSGTPNEGAIVKEPALVTISPIYEHDYYGECQDDRRQTRNAYPEFKDWGWIKRRG